MTKKTLYLLGAIAALTLGAINPAFACYTHTKGTYKEAYADYAQYCTEQREDCDELSGIKVCSSGNISDSKTLANYPWSGAANNTAITDPDPDPVPDPDPSIKCHTYTKGTYKEAYADFAQYCPDASKRDCDAISGLKVCYDGTIPDGATLADYPSPANQQGDTGGGDTGGDSGGDSGNDSGSSSGLTVQAEILSGHGWVVKEGYYIQFTGSNSFPSVTHPALRYELQVPSDGDYQLEIRSKTTGTSDKTLNNDSWFNVGGHGWEKIFQSAGGVWTTSTIADSTKKPLVVPLTKGPVVVELSGRSFGHAIDWISLIKVGDSSGGGGDIGGGSGPFYSLHSDNARDPDDVIANIIMKMIADRYNIARDNIVVVTGTVGDCDRTFRSNSTPLMQDIWGQVYNAWTNFDSSVNQVAAKWATALQQGRKVIVSEGGRHGFSTAVLKHLKVQYPGLNLKNVIITQHSQANLDKSCTSDVNYDKSTATYLKIGDGNRANNNTPDFKIQSTAAKNYAKGLPTYGPLFQKGFAYFESIVWKDKTIFDGSDAVGLLFHIDNDRYNTIADFVYDF